MEMASDDSTTILMKVHWEEAVELKGLYERPVPIGGKILQLSGIGFELILLKMSLFEALELKKWAGLVPENLFIRLASKKKMLNDKSWQKIFKEQTQKKKAKKLCEIQIGILAEGIEIITQVHEAVKLQKKEERAKNLEKPSVRVARLLKSIKQSDKLKEMKEEQKGKRLYPLLPYLSITLYHPRSGLVESKSARSDGTLGGNEGHPGRREAGK